MTEKILPSGNISRNTNFDILRCVCALFIIFIHVSGSYWNCVAVNSNYFVAMTFYNGISRFAVPTFVMISGMMMIPKNLQGKYLLKKILRLIGCFYIWSFFYAFQGIAFNFILGKPVTLDALSNSLQRFIYGHYHQWFLLMIAGIYIILPFIQKICVDKKIMEYFIILWIINSIIVPLLPLQGITSQLQLHFPAGYIGYFVMGYYLSQYPVKKNYRIGIYILGIIGTIYTIAATIYESQITGSYIEKHFGSYSWNVLLMAVSMFVFFQYNVKKENPHKKRLLELAKTTLIVYMLHPFFIEKLNKIGINVIKHNPWWTVPAISIFIYIVSTLIALAINHVLKFFSVKLHKK